MSYDENAPVLVALRSLLLPRDQKIFTVTIPSGQNMSSVVDFGSARLRRIDMPSEWTDAYLQAFVSLDGVEFGPLVTSGHSYFLLSCGENTRTIPDSEYWQTVRFLKLRSVATTGSYEIAQAADRIITLIAY